MIVDTSASSLLCWANPARRISAKHWSTRRILVSRHPRYVELCAVLQRRNRPEIGRLVDRLLAAYGIEIETFDAEQARVAAQAYRDYGRGSGHPARLNLGDSYSYALAHIAGEPLLPLGVDFIHTDIRSALS